MPHKCIVWGIGNDYEKIVNQLQFEVAKGNIQIEALVARKQDIIESSLDGMRLISKFELRNIKFDFLIISSSVYYMEIYKEALEMGIMEEQIIKGEVMNIPLFDFGRYIRLIENNITILSDDCWGGYIYHYLCMKFYSPLINIYWRKKSYAKFIQNPIWYMEQTLQMELEGDIRKNIYPIGSLGEGKEKVYLDFVHSICFADAEKSWNRRKKRVNNKNLFIKIAIDGTDKNKEECLDVFAKLSQKKICFYSGETDLNSVTYFRRFEKFIHSGSRMDTIKYSDYCRNLNWLLKSIDVLKMLNGEEDYRREL